MGDSARPTELRSGQPVLLQGKHLNKTCGLVYDGLNECKKKFINKLTKKDLVIVRGRL